MNPGISFGNIQALLLIPLFVVGLALLNLVSVFYRKKIERWIAPSLWGQIIPEFSKKTLRLKNALLLMSMIFMCIALSRPQWGEIDEVVHTEGMDIFFLLDLSNSMLAEDASPSRLARARTFIKKTLSQIENDRVGVIGFAGNAQLSAPLTTDFQYVAEIVDTLDPGTIPSQGTNIGEAIETATRALDRSGEAEHKNSRALILITDGEDFGESALTAAKKVKDFGAGFFALSVGTTDGAPIPLRNDQGILQTYKKDSAGKPVLSRVNKELIAKIAAEAGGQYLELVNADDAAYSLAKQLRRFNRGTQQEQHVVTKIERFEIFLIIGFIFLFLYLGTGYRKARIIFGLLLFVLLNITGTNAFAANTDSLKTYLKSREGESQFQKKSYEDSARAYQEAQTLDSENSTLNYNLGTSLGSAGKTEEAITQLQEATRKSLAQGDFESAARSLYNEGIAQSQNKNNPEAYDRLTKSIEMAKISNQPDVERKAREELTRLAIQQQNQQKNQSKDDKKDQKKDNKDQQDQNKKDKGDQDKKNKEDDKGDNKENQKDQKQNPSGIEKKREFRSGTLSKDTAESIMNDLSDREKQLYHQRLKDKRKEIPNGKDW